MARIARVAAILAVPLLGAMAEPDVAGLWLTQDGAGVVEIAPCEGGICGWLVGFRDQPPPMNYKGSSECGWEFIFPSQLGPDGRWHGEIIDPMKGQRYRADFAVAADGRLNLRGYLGISLFGETQIWTRFQGGVDSACKISAG